MHDGGANQCNCSLRMSAMNGAQSPVSPLSVSVQLIWHLITGAFRRSGETRKEDAALYDVETRGRSRGRPGSPLRVRNNQTMALMV